MGVFNRGTRNTTSSIPTNNKVPTDVPTNNNFPTNIPTDVPTNNKVPTSTYNPANPSKVDMTTSSTRIKVVEDIKKMESDQFTSLYSSTITNSSFYKNNKGKLQMMGLTVAGVAGWFGTLLAMGYSPAEARDIIKETVNNWVEAAAGAAGDAGGAAAKKVLELAWAAFVTFVHSSVGHYLFEEKSQTEQALKALFIFLLLYKIFGFFGINIVTLPFKIFNKSIKS